MLSRDRAVIVGAIAVAAFGVLVAAKMPPRGGDQSFVAADAAASEINPAALTIASRTDVLVEDAAMLSLEPDPAMFDRAGVETWWSSYRQKHHAK